MHTNWDPALLLNVRHCNSLGFFPMLNDDFSFFEHLFLFQSSQKFLIVLIQAVPLLLTVVRRALNSS